MPKGVSRPDGRSGNHRKVAGEESPGSIDIRCRITSGGGDPRDSATENEPLPPPCLPRSRGGIKGGDSKGEKVRSERTAGPATETAWQTTPGARPNRDGNAAMFASAITPQGDVRLAVRVGCSRQRANVVPEEWPSRIVWAKQTMPYKTRLTGWLISTK